MRHWLLALALLLLLAAGAARAGPVLLISIEGLRPGDVLEAEARGLKIPNLRGPLQDGAYATGVVGVLPTVTYLSHATLTCAPSPRRWHRCSM